MLYLALRAGYNTGMTGINSQKQMIAPRQTPGSPFSNQSNLSLGGKIKNPPKTTFNRLTNTESVAQNQRAQFFQNPESVSPSPNNEFHVAPTQPLPPSKVTPSPEVSIETVKPGEYHPGYCDQIIRYFDRPKTKKIYDSYTWKSGAVSEKERFVPNTPPHFSEFARSIGVTTRTLSKWCRENPEFRDAYQVCQEIFEEFLIDNGLVGSYGAVAMKFVAVNRSKMKDKQVHENQNIDLNKVLDAIADGKVRPGGIMELPGEEEY